ncbi:MOSC domain-containing protein [Nocardioides sp. 1609]|uniref:MOSC domain-containing protein n=1 Tax=Nocardioides sp. 1609 TaxID=2508327 RepID=UPI00106FEEEA|nr:MOSC domain-containing protein [Nocardioides sp. 1609]
MPHVQSVHVGRPQPVTWVRSGRTSIEKATVTGPVAVGPLGLDGDEVSNRRHHGGPDKAVYAFAREDLDRWAGTFGADVPDGTFGENLTTRGVDVNGAEIGERWRIGEDVVVEVTMFRTPCRTFQVWLGRQGYDNRAWARRFAEDGRPGAYLRVVSPGVLQAGDPVEVVHRPGTGVTVSSWFGEVVRGPRS